MERKQKKSTAPKVGGQGGCEALRYRKGGNLSSLKKKDHEGNLRGQGDKRLDKLPCLYNHFEGKGK